MKKKPNQLLVAIDRELADAIDEAVRLANLPSLGGVYSRASWIREAIREKLKRSRLTCRELAGLNGQQAPPPPSA